MSRIVVAAILVVLVALTAVCVISTRSSGQSVIQTPTAVASPSYVDRAEMYQVGLALDLVPPADWQGDHTIIVLRGEVNEAIPSLNITGNESAYLTQAALDKAMADDMGALPW